MNLFELFREVYTRKIPPADGAGHARVLEVVEVLCEAVERHVEEALDDVKRELRADLPDLEDFVAKSRPVGPGEGRRGMKITGEQMIAAWNTLREGCKDRPTNTECVACPIHDWCEDDLSMAPSEWNRIEAAFPLASNRPDPAPTVAPNDEAYRLGAALLSAFRHLNTDAVPDPAPSADAQKINKALAEAARRPGPVPDPAPEVRDNGDGSARFDPVSVSVSREELAALCAALMVPDPRPGARAHRQQEALRLFADRAARAHGFADWFSAFHAEVSRRRDEARGPDSGEGRSWPDPLPPRTVGTGGADVPGSSNRPEART